MSLADFEIVKSERIVCAISSDIEKRYCISVGEGKLGNNWRNNFAKCGWRFVYERFLTQNFLWTKILCGPN
jgi:hypothetical protein